MIDKDHVFTIAEIAERLQKLKNIEKRHGFSCPNITRRLLAEIKRLEEENVDDEVALVLSKYGPAKSRAVAAQAD